MTMEQRKLSFGGLLMRLQNKNIEEIEDCIPPPKEEIKKKKNYERDPFESVLLSELAYKFSMHGPGYNRFGKEDYENAYRNRLRLIDVPEKVIDTSWQFDKEVSFTVLNNYFRHFEWFKRTAVKSQDGQFYLLGSKPKIEDAKLSEGILVSLDAWVCYRNLSEIAINNPNKYKKIPLEFIKEVEKIAPQLRDFGGAAYLIGYENKTRDLGFTQEQTELIKYNELRTLNRLSWNETKTPVSWTLESCQLSQFKNPDEFVF